MEGGVRVRLSGGPQARGRLARVAVSHGIVEEGGLNKNVHKRIEIWSGRGREAGRKEGLPVLRLGRWVEAPAATKSPDLMRAQKIIRIVVA